ncbi:nitrate- and nitrite sensing domain-containing protein [Microtetraspora malaysiensis]|uniref:nitrate- and nitrite sensing domain-containing protein n=1 Tax=Microtetraspora malaysiensis TaxID=161358 RepID=UPI00147143C7|nr:nitrate- and nitrite sensing domain-containing protein [Microtetraspora malaysiensis]
MSTEQRSDAEETAGTPSGAWARRLAPRNWRVPSRLTALIVAPTLVAVALAGAKVVDSVDSLNAYQRTSSAAEYSVRLRDLSQQLAMERDLAARGGDAKRVYNVDGSTKITLADQHGVVDGLARKVAADLAKIDDGYGVRAVQLAEQAGNRLSGLENVREKGSEEDYSGIIAGLLRLHDELGQSGDDAVVIADMRALGALANAKEEASRQRQMLTRELLEPHQRFTAYELRDFIASQSRQQGFVDRFYAETNSADAAFLAGLLSDKNVVDTELTKSWAITLAIQNVSLSGYKSRDRMVVRWFQHSTKTIEQLAVAEKRLSTAVIDRATGLQSAEQRNALIAAGLILALLMLVLATTVLIARSMVRPLRRLRAEALEIAGTRLPEVVRRMRESDDAGAAPEVQPIDLGTEDEIGEVAQAFDEVHAQAVRLAAEESRLRTHVNAMFVNLSWRTQTLVERQISLIDGLERGEQDGRRLADLFKLDHLATRMRRNSENLLVLAGHESARKRSKPALLVDVVRAALSEVEDYERVNVRVHRSASVAGHAANDSVHLVAELLENAISFSSDRTKVVVSSDRVEGGAVLLSVCDSGIGMSPDELAEANRRLSEPPAVDVSVSRRMGLFVVGRLAQRHGIRVQLRPGDSGGLIAMVLFPAALVAGDERSAPARPGAALPASGQSGQHGQNGQQGRAQIAGPAPTRSPGGGGLEPTQGGALPARGARGAAVPGQRDTRTPAPGATTPAGDASPGRANGLPTRKPAASGFSAAGGAQIAPGGFSAFGDQGQQDTESFPAIGTAGRTADDGAAAQPGWSAPAGYSARHSDHDGRPGAGPSDPAGRADRPGVAGSRPSVPESPLNVPRFTEHSGAFPIGAATPMPSPVSDDTHLERGDEFLPIFAAVESAWFRRPAQQAAGAVRADGGGTGARETPGADLTSGAASGATAARPSGDGAARGSWGSQADSGYRAAAAASAPTTGGVTDAGLPRRTPKANLVPGSVDAVTSTPDAARPAVSPDLVRSRLSSYQQGVRRGRADVSGSGAAPGNEEESS